MKKYQQIIIVLLFILVTYYFILPPINLSSPLFWNYFFLILIFAFAISLTNYKFNLFKVNGSSINFKNKKNKLIYGIAICIISIILLINIFNMPLFNSKSYYERIAVSDSNFTTDVKEVNFGELALLDKDSSTKLGDRVMGQMTDLVSQFYVSDLYTQIDYKDTIVRVTPLEYSGFIKYLTNYKDGVKGYITVNSVTGDADLKRLDSGMKYLDSSYFFQNLDRKLRLSYPMTIFGEKNFELDEDGNPYWIVETVGYSGIGLKKKINGVIILNPMTGESKKYSLNEIPTWVDHVYNSDLIIEQLNDWGKYKNGFFNSLFGQKDVVMTTDGYNYLVMDDDVYLYTGITSVSSDESNIGFVLVNLRTKETKFYNVAGAEEYSAMASAVGQVQQMNYKSTFPLLINLKGKPTYLVSLKDNAGLVKMYAFIDYIDYQKVVVTNSSEGILKAAQNYLGGSISTGKEETKDITISSIKSAVVDGITYYYIKEEKQVYKISIKVSESMLPFLVTGDSINITYNVENNEIVSIN